MHVTVAHIAQQVQGLVEGDDSICLTGFAPADSASEGDLTFAEELGHFEAAEKSRAAAIIVSGDLHSSRKTLIRVSRARVAMARILPVFFPPDPLQPGVHPSASVASDACVDSTAHVGPGCVVRSGARVGARSKLLGGNHVGRDCLVGDDVCLFQNVVLYDRSQIGDRVVIHAGTVIGSDGYGYVLDTDHHRKILQVGSVIIEADVEIGANSAIDRGALGPTRIGQGTKIDNLVHIAHNVIIGKHCLIMGQAGFAGSTRVGDYCVVASQSGIAGHLKLGNQSVVGAKSGVMRDVPEKETVLGIPALPDRQTKRQWVAAQQLPGMLKRMRDLEKQVAQLAAQLEAGSKPSSTG